MVASLGCSSLRVNTESMALMRQAIIGGKSEDFKVLWLKDWCFRFMVSSKQVGLMIYRIKKVSTSIFNMHFALWHNGGPDHILEKRRWDQEQHEEWHLVTRSKKSYASVVKGRSLPSVFSRHRHPNNYFSKNFASENFVPRRSSSAVITGSDHGT